MPLSTNQVRALAKAGAFRSGSAIGQAFTAPVTTPSIPDPHPVPSGLVAWVREGHYRRAENR
ncbi:hypothetical protein WP1_074 [Pseudomonas phage WP1]